MLLFSCTFVALMLKNNHPWNTIMKTFWKPQFLPISYFHWVSLYPQQLVALIDNSYAECGKNCKYSLYNLLRGRHINCVKVRILVKENKRSQFVPSILFADKFLAEKIYIPCSKVLKNTKNHFSTWFKHQLNLRLFKYHYVK